MIHSWWQINLSNWVSMTKGVLFPMTQPGPAWPKPVQRAQRASTRIHSRAYYVWHSPRPRGAGKAWISAHSPTPSSPFSTTDHGGLTMCLLPGLAPQVPPWWWISPPRAPPHTESSSSAVDTLSMPTEGGVCFLAIQEREGPRNPRRAPLGRVIGPHRSK